MKGPSGCCPTTVCGHELSNGGGGNQERTGGCEVCEAHSIYSARWNRGLSAYAIAFDWLHPARGSSRNLSLKRSFMPAAKFLTLPPPCAST